MEKLRYPRISQQSGGGQHSTSGSATVPSSFWRELKLLGSHYWVANSLSTSLRIWVSGVQYAWKNDMFGMYDGLVMALTKEKTRTACCRGELRQWCNLECRGVSRDG